MALINCSECGKEISNKAVACPNCGNPMAAKPLKPIEQIDQEFNINHGPIEVKAKEGCFLQTLNAGCMIIFIIIGLVAVIILLGSC